MVAQKTSEQPVPERRGGGALLVAVMSVVLGLVLVVLLMNWPSAPAAAPTAQGTDQATSDPREVPPPTWLPVAGAVSPGASPLPYEFLSTPGPTTATTQGSTPMPSAPVGDRFEGLTGDGCANTEDSGSFAVYPAGKPATNLAGGWSGPGCAGGWFWSLPMSGTATKDDPAVYVIWWFKTPRISVGTCAIWTYVPSGARTQDVSGKPTFYQVTRGRDDERVIGTFTVDQTAKRPAWVYVGAYNYEGGKIAVKLGNRGTGENGTRHAAAQVRVICWSR